MITSYTWDFENRLSSVTKPDGSLISFKYDPFGRRIRKASATTVTAYVYDGAAIIATLNQSEQWTARYVHGAGIDEPLALQQGMTTDYYQADGLGSITSLTDSTGAIANTYTYDSFGNSTASTEATPQPFHYTGREFDPETGLYYYRARYYEPQNGRFLSEDPIGFDGGVNLYVPFDNDPVDLIDPFGYSTDSYNLDLRNHGAPHIDRVDKNGKLVGRYNPDGTPLKHKGKTPPNIPNSDRDKFDKAAEKLRKKTGQQCEKHGTSKSDFSDLENFFNPIIDDAGHRQYPNGTSPIHIFPFPVNPVIPAMPLGVPGFTPFPIPVFVP